MSHALDDASLSSFHKRLAIYSSGGPFLDGYILSIIGVAMVQVTPEFGLSASAQGLVGAAALIGIFFGAFLGGRLTDRFGRHLLFTVDLIALLGCSVLQAFVQNAVWLIILRLLIGVAVGADYPIATSLLAEFTPRRYRGKLLGAYVTMWFVGAAAAYVVGQFLLEVDGGWRWMLASSALPALVIILLRLGTPESPRWLVKVGRTEEAQKVLTKVYGEGATIADLADEGTANIGVRELIRSGYGKRMAFITIFWTCSIVPLFAVYAFGPAILDAFGLGGDLSHIGSAVITVLFLVGCLVAVALIDRMGRRSLIMHSFAWSGLALLALGLFPNAGTGVIITLFAAYALLIGGTQILQWVYPNELFPTEIRGSAVGLASSLSRIGAAAGTYLVPLVLSGLGIGTTMIIAGVITLLGLAVSFAWAPETRGKTLAECAALETVPLERKIAS
ncbi:MFS transporter [Amycolatopsis sp. OK19-0408]|uniref:MFS transporter n=1 Tax=Amycolatopsis iheyensis TaxID=2945988 RepID=A0A9X2NII7_9PSEU|nr:MFS transporter [Amycolatopsis iheyensis]MCR6487355.1 MFS transporter [Amycolatopsis iheyensis]